MPKSTVNPKGKSVMIKHWAFIILVLFGAYYVWGHWVAKKF